jgi:hypothetical protein
MQNPPTIADARASTKIACYSDESAREGISVSLDAIGAWWAWVDENPPPYGLWSEIAWDCFRQFGAEQGRQFIIDAAAEYDDELPTPSEIEAYNRPARLDSDQLIIDKMNHARAAGWQGPAEIVAILHKLDADAKARESKSDEMESIAARAAVYLDEPDWIKQVDPKWQPEAWRHFQETRASIWQDVQERGRPHTSKWPDLAKILTGPDQPDDRYVEDLRNWIERTDGNMAAIWEHAQARARARSDWPPEIERLLYEPAPREREGRDFIAWIDGADEMDREVNAAAAEFNAKVEAGLAAERKTLMVQPTPLFANMPLPVCAPVPAALRLDFFDDCRKEPKKNWIIKGVLAEDEDSTWYGLPGKTKSMLLTDIAVHVAAGRDWRGYKSRKKVGVVYLALERASLTKRRLAAYAVRDNAATLPIAVAGDLIDLLNPDCVQIIVATIKSAETRFGCPVGLLIVDSWAKAVAAGGADEDKAQYVNLIAANLKRVHDQLGHPIHIASVGHSGKDETKGERGSNAKEGHVDMAVRVTGDVVRTATITKGNDVGEGALTAYRVEGIAIGIDEDDEPVMVGILDPTIVDAMPKAVRSARHDIALNALDRAIRDCGQEVQGDNGKVHAVAVEQWRQELFRCGVIERDAANSRMPFKRLKDGLVAKNLVAERDGFVWSLDASAVMPAMPGRD